MSDTKKLDLNTKIDESKQSLKDCTDLLVAMKKRAVQRVAKINADLKASEQQHSTGSENIQNFSGN